MRTIGLIGGMSWESTLHYYRLINQQIHDRLGGHHSAKLVLLSLDFDPIEKMQRRGAWDEAAKLLSEAGNACVKAGAEGLVLCTNTMHLVADAIAEAAGVPFLHIAAATGEVLQKRGVRRVALLGTRFTMEEPFYRGYLEEKFGLEVLVPEPDERAEVDRVIFEELVHGKVVDSSRSRYVRILDNLAEAGAEAAILGCTEIGMLLKEGDHRLPLFDTTEVHAAAAVSWSLEEPY